MSFLDVSGAEKAFGSAMVLGGVNLGVAQGEFVSLLGPSGCGKTTTLRLVSGFAVPDGGSISVAGRQVSAAGSVVPPERRLFNRWKDNRFGSFPPVAPRPENSPSCCPETT